MTTTLLIIAKDWKKVKFPLEAIWLVLYLYQEYYADFKRIRLKKKITNKVDALAQLWNAL